MKGILLTAFGPFPGVPVNPTGALMQRLRERLEEADASWRFEELEVSYDACRNWCERLAPERYRAIIQLGVAQKRRVISLERYGRRECTGERPDASGCIEPRFEAPTGSALTAAPAIYETRLDLTGIRERLANEGAPIELSEDAGGYVCNFLYYHTLARVAACGASADVLFVHVPPLEALPLDAQVHWMQRILRELDLTD